MKVAFYSSVGLLGHVAVLVYALTIVPWWIVGLWTAFYLFGVFCSVMLGLKIQEVIE